MESVLSGIQPSSIPHLGNYLGAIRNWINLPAQYDCYYLIVDLHAITVAQDPMELWNNTYEMVAFYIAAGLDPERVALFVQSHLAEHAELAWVLTCCSYMGELSRMTQFKDKSQRQGKNIGAGLFTYPALMAADILLYRPHLIPVGEDQKQHIELTRNLAERFNHRFQKEVFKVPEPLIFGRGARIMDLQNPTAKMSKSAENLKGVVFMNETDKQISKKIKSAVTDSGTEVTSYGEAGAGIRNLIDIYASLSGRQHEEIASEFSGKMYGHLKVATAELAVEVIAPIRNEAGKLMTDKAYLDQVLKRGAEKARVKARQTLRDVYQCLGLVAPSEAAHS